MKAGDMQKITHGSALQLLRLLLTCLSNACSAPNTTQLPSTPCWR